ncbi:MAG: hypothetical protein Q7U14_03420 [Lacisediminimonas sp.]|nr:hypothetical protein [Lacisediminimonas sp.]
MRTRPLILLSLITVLALGAGCSSAGDGAREPAAGPQLIVKFRSGTLACDDAGIARLSAQAGLRLRLIRPMSGDACVIRLQDAVDSAATAAALAAIRGLPPVQYAEPDAPMRAS